MTENNFRNQEDSQAVVLIEKLITYLYISCNILTMSNELIGRILLMFHHRFHSHQNLFQILTIDVSSLGE